jgi:transcriptional regulator with XRE-family HTH domain
MHAAKRKKLETAGWKTGNAADFLGLSPVEEALVEMKVSLANAMRKLRETNKLSQGALAKMIGSSQSRVAKMESGDSTVSIDLILKSMVTLGAQPDHIAKAITKSKLKRKAPAERRVAARKSAPKKVAAKRKPSRKAAVA